MSDLHYANGFVVLDLSCKPFWPAAAQSEWTEFIMKSSGEHACISIVKVSLGASKTTK